MRSSEDRKVAQSDDHKDSLGMARGFPTGQGVHPALESEAHECRQAGEET